MFRRVVSTGVVVALAAAGAVAIPQVAAADAATPETTTTEATETVQTTETAQTTETSGSAGHEFQPRGPVWIAAFNPGGVIDGFSSQHRATAVPVQVQVLVPIESAPIEDQYLTR